MDCIESNQAISVHVVLLRIYLVLIPLNVMLHFGQRFSEGIENCPLSATVLPLLDLAQ